MHLTTETIIRVLTMGSLAGLLLAVGLRLTPGEVLTAVRRCRLLSILLVNFVAVPLLVLGLVRAFGLGREMAIGMVLLAAAPFAPVVPVFARMAGADLALAAGLTALFPFLSAFFTPWVCEAALRGVPGGGSVPFNAGLILLTLFSTITLPLALGVAVNHFAPRFGSRVRRPMEMISEGTGAVSLAFVTWSQLGNILNTGPAALAAMVLASELAFLLGHRIGAAETAARRVIALGTSNRNIALALLIAIQAFPGSRVMAGVVANGLVVILLGLLHVAAWRWLATRQSRLAHP
jgi:BASS family bile acid:Na+ symporter